MNRCVIIAGAAINDYEYIKSALRADDFYVFCDSGLRHMAPLGVKPNLIVGDFDSHENPDLPVETIVLPREKDDTDTFFAAKQAIDRGFDEFLLIGAAGARLDHTLGNISILIMLHSLGKKATLIDDYSEMQMIGESPVKIENCIFFSLLNVTGKASGITITGAKYPLVGGEIRPEYQFGVSNEVLPGEVAEVLVAEGELLLIKVRRE